MERFVDRFLRYVKKNTRSDESKAGIVIPSTPSQMEFLEELSEELKRIGLEDVKINKKNAFLTATVPANVENAENIEEDFRKVCDTFSNKNLQSDKLYVLYVTKEDLDKFEEYRMDYVFNKCNYYYRISRLYDNVDKIWLDDIDILEGDKEYGK